MSEQGSAAPETASASFERARALEGFGRRDEALAELRRGLAGFPDDADLHGYLGWLQFFSGLPEEAGASAQRALALRPGDARALNVLCEVAVAAGRAEEGLASARDLQRHFPEWQVSHLNAAYALLAIEGGPREQRRRRRAEVRENLDRALRLAPEDVETLRRATIMLRRLDEQEAASETLDRALALDPSNEDLLLLAAEREAGRTSGPQHLQGLGLSAGHDAAALRLLSGVLAENPEHRGAAREISDHVWIRTQLLAGTGLWLLAMLSVFAYLVFGEPSPGSHRTQLRFAEALLILPAGWFVLLFTIRRKGLPPRFMRRLYAPVWWVWIGFALAAVGGLGTLLWALVLGVRSGETQLATQGSYVGGVTMGIGFTAWLMLTAELLFVFARFRSEQRTGLFPRDAGGAAAARAELRGGLWGLIRVGVAALLALMPLYASPIAMRPEAAGVLAPVAASLALPPVVALLLRLGRLLDLRGRRRGPAVGIALAVSLALSAAGLVGVWLLADRHASEFDPPPTPWELEMRERGARLQESIDDLESSLPALPSQHGPDGVGEDR